jgi:formylglycine-generating enzyme required for sulfatase activity
LALAEVLPVLRQVAAALDYAHSKKVVHRDVKPGNVMIDGEGEVKVLDFGLAAQIRTSLSRASQAYRGTSGTGPYMSPEQWEGQPQDGKADQYALGVVAYEMLAGRLPFENTELPALKNAVLHGELRDIPGLDKRSMAALRRAMAKNPAERWWSCGAFVEALEGKRPRDKRKTAKIAGWLAAVAVAVAAGAGIWGWQVAAKKAEAARLAEEERVAREAKEAWLAEEARRAEAERIAAEEEAARVEAERKRAEEEERIRQERAALEAEVHRLAAEARSKTAAAEGEGYDRGQGFGARLDEAKSKLQQGEAAVGEGDFERAKTALEGSLAAAGWLEENAPLRDQARRILAAAAAAKKKADAMEGARLAEASYRRGNERGAAGAKAFREASFRAAEAAGKEAGAAYAAAFREARAEKINRGLVAAREALEREEWDAAESAAEGVLALEPGNAEAARLKEESENLREPTIELSATLDGRPVAATVEEGPEAGKTTPLTVELASGGTYAFALAYEAGGKTYSGRATVEAKERGRTAATVALAERAAGETKTIILPGGETMEMAWCPPGTFLMGSPVDEKGRDKREEMQHRVTLTKGFWIAKTEVTLGQWASVLGGKANPKERNMPMVMKTWDQFVEFCQKAGHGLQLPTEAQWEYACRAGTTGPYAGTGKLDDMGWHLAFRLGPAEHTHPVAQKQPNAWGLYDMHGNVWEWCADWYQENLGADPVTDPTGPATGKFRVCRGGSWYEPAKNCRSASRGYNQNPSWMGDFSPVLGIRPISFHP